MESSTLPQGRLWNPMVRKSEEPETALNVPLWFLGKRMSPPPFRDQQFINPTEKVVEDTEMCYRSFCEAFSLIIIVQ